jgi:hypothetical protein
MSRENSAAGRLSGCAANAEVAKTKEITNHALANLQEGISCTLRVFGDYKRKRHGFHEIGRRPHFMKSVAFSYPRFNVSL